MMKLFSKLKKSSAVPSPEKEKKRSYIYLLEFRCRGRLIVSAKTDTLGSIVKIGRAPDNDWIVPPEDRVAGDYQAELHLDSGHIRLQACGKANFHSRGKTITNAQLKQNDRISIGDCELFVKPAEQRESRPCDVHRLEFRNGPREGELIRLEKNLIRIGSDPDNDIVLKDDVVSRFHAEIRIAENGESWIRDLDSINGTFVNGARLGRQERMLMDSDEISVAFFDMTFLDRNVPHARSQIGRKMLIMGGTVLVILLFFGIFYATTPQAVQLLNAAEFYMRRADFNAAQRMLDAMPGARDYQRYEKHHQDHLLDIARYRKTFAAWNEFKQHLNNSEWQDAAECFGRLESDDRFAWNWEDATVDERMAEVRHAKKLLDLQFRIRHLLVSMDAEPENQCSLLKELKNSVFRPLEKEPEYLRPLRGEIQKLTAELEKNCANLHKLKTVLEQLNTPGVPFKPLISEINKLQVLSSGSVRVHAEDLAEALKELEKNRNAVEANQTALLAMQFDRIAEEIQFVSRDECLISPLLMNKRDSLIQRQNDILNHAESLKSLLARLEKAGFGEQGIPASAKRFADEAELRNAFQFSELKEKMPTPRRTTPCGVYDSMFGIRFFYSIIQQTALQSANVYSDDLAASLDFHPECIRLRSLYLAAEETGLWLRLPQNRWMLQDAVQRLYKRCTELLGYRDSMLAALNRIADSAAGTRVWFAAKAAYFYFAPASSISRQEMQAYASAWKRFRMKQQELTESYDPLKLREAEQLRSRILAEGLPGDPVVNWFWSQDK